MYLRANSIIDEDYRPAACAAASVEPMRRADHKAKRHPRPVRLVRYARPARRVVERECGE